MNKLKTKKILFYSDTPLYGGAEKQMQLLAEHLDDDFEPIFLIRQTPELENWATELQRNGFKTYLCPSKSKHSLINLKYLLNIIKNEKPDLLHAHIWNPMACKYIFLSKKISKLPLVITEHDPFSLGFVKKLYKKWAIRLADQIITVSDANRKLMLELYPFVKEKITTVHNGISLKINPISNEQKKRIKKDIFKASDHNQILLAVATLHPRKGLKYLIKAFQKIHNKKPSTRLIIAGEGPERVILEKLISNLGLVNKVMLLGQRDDINKLMQSADLFILPSLKEAFGLVIIEAFATGLPVIATEVGGIPEIIINQKNGLLIKPANRFAIEKAIEKLLRHPQLAQTLAKNAKITLKEFSANKMALETEKIYKLLLNS